MSFETYETSRARGGPQQLYLFRVGADYYCYTDAERQIVHQVDGDTVARTFVPLPIDRGKIVSSGSADKVTLSVNMPKSTPVAELFRIFPPSDIVWLTIFIGHDSDPDIEFMAIWSGRVLSGIHEGSKASLQCEPVTTSIKRPGLRRRYQYGCPHPLYGRSCGVDRTAFTVTATVASVSGYQVGFSSGWEGAFTKAHFANGLFDFVITGSRHAKRTILQVNTTTNVLTISGAIPDLVVGSTVSLSLGCDHQMTGCNSFGNIQNFGGQPWIPLKSPLGFTNKFY